RHAVLAPPCFAVLPLPVLFFLAWALLVPALCPPSSQALFAQALRAPPRIFQPVLFQVSFLSGQVRSRCKHQQQSCASDGNASPRRVRRFSPSASVHRA